MSILTDTDILRLKDREIIIEPFDSGSLTPVGYDLSVGDFVVSLTRGVLSPNPETHEYKIKPKEIILILSKEYLWVSGRIAGTIHSKVSLASKGFSHISTTLDPEWKGKLLISLTNLSNDELILRSDQSYATVVFYTTKSQATKKSGKPHGRFDLLLELINRINPDVSQREAENSQKAMIEKFKTLLSEQEIASLESKIKATHIGSRAASAAREMLLAHGKKALLILLHFIAIFVLIYAAWNLEAWFPEIKQSIMMPVALSASAAILMTAFKILNE